MVGLALGLGLCVAAGLVGLDAAAKTKSRVSRIQLRDGDVHLILQGGALGKSSMHVQVAWLRIDAVEQPLKVRCDSTHAGSLVVREFMMTPHGAHKYTGIERELKPVHNVFQFTVTPDPAGDYAYSIAESTGASYSFGGCTVETIG